MLRKGREGNTNHLPNAGKTNETNGVGGALSDAPR